RPDIAVLAALASGAPILALHYPLISAVKDLQAHYWSPADWGSLAAFYILFGLLMCLSPAMTLLRSRSMAKERTQDYRRGSRNASVDHSVREADEPGPYRRRLTPWEWIAFGACPLMP